MSTEILFSSGVLTERGERVSLSSRFEASIEDYRATIDGVSRDELGRLLGERVDEDAVLEPLVRLGEIDPRTVAELCALHEHLRTRPENWLSLLPALRLFRPDSGPTDGVPGPFVPVPGEHLPHLAAIYSRILVYVWLDDCPPCDALQRRLESVFDRPLGVLLFAVYGPDHREFLAEAYDVTAGPALLFVRDGAIDARLYGDHAEGVVEREVERLCEDTSEIRSP